jgi:hypothetical protein
MAESYRILLGRSYWKTLLHNPIPEKKKDNRNVIAYRLSPKLVPMFEELAKEAFDAKLIPRPTILALSRFSLRFFAEIWIQQKAARARYEQE